MAWSRGLVAGARINLASIPEEYDLRLEALKFDPVEMQRLYDFGFNQMMEGKAWRTQEPPKNLDELEYLLNLYEMLSPIDPPEGTRGDIGQLPTTDID